MPGLRLLADDLTGALDSAAAFASVLGPVRVVWDGQSHADSLAIDSGTREGTVQAAAERVRGLAPLLAPAPGRLSFFKVDSLLRGHAGRELAALVAAVPFDAVVIAPAIPFQNRRTRNGRQQRLEPGGWIATGEDIVGTLNAAGHFVAVKRAGETVPDGISMWDAEAEADLDRIVAAAATKQSVLYVGAAGLAGSLARRIGNPVPPVLPGLPLLGLVGTDHSVMTAQLQAMGDDHVRIGVDIDAAGADIQRRLSSRAFAFVSCDLPAKGREVARAAIARRFAALCRRVPPPAALFVSGGETLAALCRDLGAEALDVTGEFEPGLPLSTVVGGAWHGVSVISKSGAFGSPDTLLRLVASLTPQTAKAN